MKNIMHISLLLCFTIISKENTIAQTSPCCSGLTGVSYTGTNPVNTSYANFSVGFYGFECIGAIVQFVTNSPLGIVTVTLTNNTNPPFNYYITTTRVTGYVPNGTYTYSAYINSNQSPCLTLIESGSFNVANIDCGVEVCNNVDDDCDGQVDEGFIKTTYYTDADNDGYGAGAGQLFCNNPGTGWSLQAGDCNDGNIDINPNTIWYLDADNDGYYTGTGVTQCASPGTGYRNTGVTGGDDCNDDPATGGAAIYPGAPLVNCNSSLIEIRRTVASKGIFCPAALEIEFAFTSNYCYSSWSLAESATQLLGQGGSWIAAKGQTIIASVPALIKTNDVYHFIAYTGEPDQPFCLTRFDVTAGVSTKGCDGIVSSVLKKPLSAAGASDAEFEFTLTASACNNQIWTVILTNLTTGEQFGGNDDQDKKISIGGLPAGTYKLGIGYVGFSCAFPDYGQVVVPEPSFNLATVTATLISQINSISTQPWAIGMISKLNNAVTNCNNGNPTASVNQINAFINQVNAKRNHGLTNEQADALITKANAIIAAINNGTANCNSPTNLKATITTEKEGASKHELKSSIYPNPNKNYFNLAIAGDTYKTYSLMVYDIQGRLVEVKDNLQTNKTIRFGETLKAGTYLVEVFNNAERRTFKIVKIN